MLERFETTGIVRQIEALTALVEAQRAEIARLAAELQADRIEAQAMRERQALENDALRAEVQAERAAFMAGIQHMQHLEALIRQSQPSGMQDIERLVATMDAALVTMVVNQAPG